VRRARALRAAARALFEAMRELDPHDALLMLGTVMSTIIALQPAEQRPLLIGKCKEALDRSDAKLTERETGSH